MKKIRIALLSIFVFLFGSMLAACQTDNTSIRFTEDELLVSVGETINLEDYVNSDKVSLNDIDFKLENTQVITIEDNVLTAHTFGNSYVYASYKNNIVASLNVIVRRQFDAPTTFNLSEDGTFSWNAVNGLFPGNASATIATRYLVSGVRELRDSNDPSVVLETEEIEITVATNSIKFTEQGLYTLTVKTLEYDRFDESVVSEAQIVSYGAMDVPEDTSFTWTTAGVFGWGSVEGAKYAVVIDGMVMGLPQTQTSMDLSGIFNTITPGIHRLGLYVVDPTGNKMPAFVEALEVQKLNTPQQSYTYTANQGGVLTLSSDEEIDHYEVFLSKGNNTERYNFDHDHGVANIAFNNLSAGSYLASAIAHPVDGLYYQSQRTSVQDIYKFASVAIEANGESAANGTMLKLKSTTSAPIDSAIDVYVNDTRVNAFNFVDGECEFTLTLSSAGVYRVKAFQRAVHAENDIAGKNVYAINSDFCNEIEVVKLADIGPVAHTYEANKSVLSFAEIDNATSYVLQVLVDDEYEDVNTELFTQTTADGVVKFTFNDKIENVDLCDENGVYTFRVCARDEDHLSIDSRADKILTKLGVAQAQQRLDTNKTYSWTTVEHADMYNVEVFTIDKATFLADETDIDTSSLERTRVEARQNSYEFTNVGYYLVKVTALSEHPDDYVSATISFDKLVCVAEQLVVGDITLAFDGENYLLKLENVANVSNFAISLDGNLCANIVATNDDTTPYQLNETFGDATKDFEISVVVSAEDTMLYLDSDAKLLTIRRLPTPTRADVTIEDWRVEINQNLQITSKAQNLSINAVANAKGVKLWETANANNWSGGNTAQVAVYDFSTKSNIELGFKYFGSAMSGQNFVAENDKVYLDSATATFTFTRITALTDFTFYDGDLVFTNPSTTITEEYMLSVFSKDISNHLYEIVLRLGNGTKAVLAGQEYVLSTTENFVSNSGSIVTIALGDLLEALEASPYVAIKQIYEQATQVGFAVYVKPKTDLTNREMSYYATLEEDALSNVVIAEKMDSPELTYEISGANIIFNWTPISVRAAVEAETTYQVYVNGNRYNSAISGVSTASYSLSEFSLSTFYSICVKAENPYYLDSNESNVVRIYRLDSIKSLKLLSGGEYDGQLEYSIVTEERNFVDYVLVDGLTQNTSGKIVIDNNATITLQAKGKVETNGNTTTHYIDSATTLWNLSTMNTLIAVADETITYLNGVISWGEFAEDKNFDNLEYVLMFEDSSNNVAIFTTTATQVNLNTNDSLFQTIAGLVEGDVTLKIYAHLKTYSVLANGTIYYANEIVLANNEELCNYHEYSNVLSIKKLTTPVVSSVRFDYTNDFSDATTPDIIFEVVGNYGESAQFRIAIDGEVLKDTTVARASDKYTFTLTSVEYENLMVYGTTYEIEIYALSSTHIPSSVGSVNIVRAGQITSADFREDEIGYSQTVAIAIDEDYQEMLSGGLVLKVVYTPDGGSETTTYLPVEVSNVTSLVTFDLSSFIKTNLPHGGEIKVGAIINNYAESASSTYILSCSNYVEGTKKDVLSQLENADITLSSGGFEIATSVNGTQAEYIFELSGREYVVTPNNDMYYFEFDPTWVNGSYQLASYAVQGGCVRSASNNITFSLNRLATVSQVTLTRSGLDLSQVTLSWTNVSGATGYNIRLYNANDELLYRTTCSTASATIEELFGEDFEDIFDYGEILTIDEDIDVKIGISAIGTSASQNDSNEYVFNATIIGNDFEANAIAVDEFGIVTIATEVGQKYLYKFVNGLGEDIDDVAWTRLNATAATSKIDASFLNDKLLAGQKFNLFIKKVGSDNAVSTDNDFTIDSTVFSTMNRTIKFVATNDIVSVDFEITAADQITFILENGSFDKLYVGATSNALLDEEVFDIVPEFVAERGEHTSVYKYSIYQLLDDLNTKLEIEEGNTRLYFWTNLEIGTNIENSYINSQAYEFNFIYANTTELTGIENYTTEVATSTKDLERVFALFQTDVNNETVGVLVKITDEEETSRVFFIDYNALTSSEYYDAEETLALNITAIFEREEMIDAVGQFVVDFAKIKYDGTTLSISKWLSQLDGAKTLIRLDPVKNLYLSSGIVSWANNAEATEKYYVYFEEIEGNGFKKLATTNNYIVANDYVGEESKFYLGVKAVAASRTGEQEIYIVPSKTVYIKKDNQKAEIFKNQINTKLVLRDGKMFFEWDADGDFVTQLRDLSTITSSIANKMTTDTFNDPFSFTLKDLVGSDRSVKGTLVIRFRFTDLDRTGTIPKTIDVDAKYLLLNLLEDAELKDHINALKEVASSTTTQILTNFTTWMESGSHGIANKDALFDQFFEALQSGRYKVEYCLVGGATTLSSNWYQYENEQHENVMYINTQPRVKALKVTHENAVELNDYKILIKKTNIWSYDNVSAQYTTDFAETYVMKIYNDVGAQFVFTITNSTMTIIDQDGVVQTVSVASCDANGEENVSGDYLMFYINHNNSDSILGRYGDLIAKGSYGMQIYAVGNAVSPSSKSEYFAIRFFGLGEDLKMINGRFTWSTQSNGNTTVVYSKNSGGGQQYQEIDGSEGSLTELNFDLSGNSYGLYDYIEFLTIGGVNGNKIDVDSEIYRIENVNKLESPILTNDKAYIAIDDSRNKTVLANSYSDTELFTYKIYNNISTETSSMTFTDETKCGATEGKDKKVLLHEPGTTGMATTDGDYVYRETEKTADTFYISSVGSTVNFRAVHDVANPYYVLTLYCIDSATDNITDKGVVVSSENATLSAMMLDPVKNVKITDGKLTWTATTGRDELLVNEGATVVYKISVNQYEKTSTGTINTNTQFGDTQYFYTKSNTFDFANIEESSLDTDVQYYTITVQAMGLYVGRIVPANIDEDLVYTLLKDEGYAYRNSTYARYNDSTYYMLMSEGASLNEIERTKKVDANTLTTRNGQLVWKFTIEDENVNLENYDIFTHYMFSVYNADGNEVSGRVRENEAARDGRTFSLYFEEDPGAIADGTQVLTVYVTRIDAVTNVIMSYGTPITITKLKKIEEADISIDTSLTNPELEIFSLTNYLSTYSTTQVYATMAGSTDPFVFGYMQNVMKDSLYILMQDDEDLVLPENVVAKITIEQSDAVSLLFQAKSDLANVLYSDVSEEIVLQRSNWDEQSNITWNTTSQRFEWNYIGAFSLQQNVNAFVVTEDDGDYEITENGASLSVGTLYRVLTTIDDQTIIQVEDEEETLLYAIANEYVVGPNFIVEINYAGEERVYTTTDSFFEPTVIGNITAFSVRIKLGKTNIQSNAKEYDMSGGPVTFNLFGSFGVLAADGTTDRPYRISTEEEFLNLQHRMSKRAALYSYINKGTEEIINEGENNPVLCFKLANDITLTAFDGVLFTGDFAGVLDGDDYTITYTAKKIGEVPTFTIAKGIISQDSSVTIERGASLFETLTASAIVRNIKISAHFNQEDRIDDETGEFNTINRNAVFAGLAIINNGKLNNVEVIGYESDFVGKASAINMMYAGLVAVNVGNGAEIKNCKNLADMQVSNYGQIQMISLAGISIMNRATIENCTIGSSTIENTFRVFGENQDGDGAVSARIAGISVVNYNQAASISQCSTYANITASALDGSSWTVYLAGIVVTNSGGALADNTNNNYHAYTEQDLGVGFLNQGEIYIA